MSKKIVFITGGTRSGKSWFALEGASKIPGRHAFIATAMPVDDEMKLRIEKHREDRRDGWDTYEEPVQITRVIREIEGKYGAIIVDCLTLWLSNILLDGVDVEAEIEDLVSNLRKFSESSVFIVSNEVGMGIVPENELARKFRDMAGRLNQRVAEIADEVFITVAGIPVKIKDIGEA